MTRFPLSLVMSNSTDAATAFAELLFNPFWSYEGEHRFFGYFRFGSLSNAAREAM
jgi:hypothetical protein